jgi:pilus assembly protein CpaD
MRYSPITSRLGTALVGIGTLLLATCAEPLNPDYTQRFPLGAVPETVTVGAHFTGIADPFAGANGPRFDTLVDGYLNRGHGPITIAGAGATASAGQLAARRMEQLRLKLINAGVPESAIRMQLASEGASDTVTLSYERYTAVLPTCGDWSAPMGFNPNNSDYPGFGCAQQRNLGVMVADPADLVSAEPADPTDVQNAERVTRAYRTGTLTESVKNVIELGADQNAASGNTVGTGAGSGAGTSTR